MLRTSPAADRRVSPDPGRDGRARRSIAPTVTAGLAGLALTLAACPALPSPPERPTRTATPDAATDATAATDHAQAAEAEPLDAPPPDAGVPEPQTEAAPPPAEPPPREERIQFVLLSLDTTPTPERPFESDAHAAIYRALNRARDPAEPANSFTLFFSTARLQLAPDAEGLTEAEAAYRSPEPHVAPTFRYAEDLDEILARAERLRELSALGVELAAHGVRHLHGRTWTAEQWRAELTDFRRVLELLELEPPAGFRAPFLEGNDELYAVEEELGMTYDSSRTGGGCWPERHPGTRIWRFGVPSVVVPGGRNALLFDLNLQTVLAQAARAAGLTDETEIQAWVDDAYAEAVRDEFQRRYRGARAPFLISGHGGFRQPTLQVMSEVCGLPRVRCAPFREAAGYLDAHPALEGVCE